MNKYISLLVVASSLLFVCPFVYAQPNDKITVKASKIYVKNNLSYSTLKKTDANVVGHVIDSKTHEHLSYINVSVKGTTIGTLTDDTGHFFLKNLPVGDFTLVFASVGYKTVEIPSTFIREVTKEVKVEMVEDAIVLDGIVVSANRNETKRKLAPSLVNVVGLGTFENTNSPTLAEGLHFQPGVRVESNCETCGFSQVRINGLDGPYTQLLIDSRAVFSSLTSIYGLEQIPSSMIDRIEVVRGGSSALFGSSAIAGTVNIITKQPLRNVGNVSHTITNFDGSSAFDNQTQMSLSLVGDSQKSGIYIYGQNRKRSGYDADKDTFTEVPEIESNTLGFRSYFKTSNYSKLTLEYHHLGEKRRGGNKLYLPPHEADVAAQIKHSIDGGGVTYDLFNSDELYKLSFYSSLQSTNRDSYYGGYGHTKGMNALGGAQFTYNFKSLLFMPASLTLGVEYSYESIDDKTYSYNHSLDQTVNVASGYIQNEWKNDKWSLLVGARVDKHHLMNNAILSPRVNIRYNPSEQINFRLGYGEGFRAPQAYDEDLHIGNVGQLESIIKLDPNLKEERSRSWSLSADTYANLGDWNFNFMIDGFYTRLSNVFILEALRETPNFLIKKRTNGPGAKVWGVNLEGKAAYNRLFCLSAGATLQRSMYDKKTTWSSDVSLAGRKKTRSPDVYGYFTMNYHPTKLITICTNATYTGNMLVPHASISDDTVDQNVKSPSFFEFGTKLSYNLTLTQSLDLIISAGVNNLFNSYQDDFDKGANRDSAYIYGPRLPRTYYMGCNIKF